MRDTIVFGADVMVWAQQYALAVSNLRAASESKLGTWQRTVNHATDLEFAQKLVVRAARDLKLAVAAEFEREQERDRGRRQRWIDYRSDLLVLRRMDLSAIADRGGS